MKFLLLILAVVALVWLLRSSLRRRRPPQVPPAPPVATSSAQPIVSCAHCGVHLPRDEALPGRGGVFCDATHRTAFEQQHPDT